MEEMQSPELDSTREEQIRALGFDPSHLTPLEQEELLELHSLCPDLALSA